MRVKTAVQISFLIVISLVIFITVIEITALYKIRENESSQKTIYSLVSMQERMNLLLKDITQATTKEQLEDIEKQFNGYENRFEEIKKALTIIDKDDLLDRIVTDIHKNTHVTKRLQQLFRHEQEIEEIFQEIYHLQEEKLNILNLFKIEYPKENKLREELQRLIYSQDNKALLILFGEVKYYSKEALYQHRDKEHVEKWINLVKKLESNYSLPYAKEYLKAIKEIGANTLKIERIEQEERRLQKVAFAILNDNHKINIEVEEQIEVLVASFLEKTHLLIGLTLFITIGFILLLAYKVSRNVGVSFDTIEEKADAYEEENLYNKEAQELAFGKQKTAVRNQLEDDENFHVGLIYKPADVLTGDIYSLYKKSNGDIIVFIVDAMGHGIMPALTSYSIASRVKQYIENIDSLEELATILNEGFKNILIEDEQVSCFFFYFNKEFSKVNYFGGGMYPALIKTDKEIIEIKSNNIPFMNFTSEIKIDTLDLNGFQSLLIYSDGLVEDSSYGIDNNHVSQMFESDFFYKTAEKITTNPMEDDTTIVLLSKVKEDVKI